MKRHVSLTSILIISIIIQLSGIIAFAEGIGADQGTPESLAVIAARIPNKDVTSVEEYINRTKAEPLSVIISPSNPRESRENWQRGNNENLNDSMYLGLMELARTQSLEDLNYSSYILDKYVKKEINAREAMTLTMTLFILTSETVDMVDQIKPPAKFEDYQNTTKLALINLEGYLWNMVKFYETNKRVYAMQAHDNFNKSMTYYKIDFNLSK